MPTIPIIQQQTRASGASLGVNPSSSRGLEAIGEAFSRLGEVQARMQERRDTLDAQSALSNLRMRATRRMVEAQGKAQPGARDFTPSFLKDFDSLVGEVSQPLTPTVRDLVQQESRSLRESMYQSALQFEAKQGLAHRSTQFDEAVDQQAVAVEMDPTQFADAMAAQLATLAMIDMLPDVRQAHEIRLRGRLTEAAASGLAKQDPEGVLAALRDGKSTDPRITGLTPEGRDRIAKQATATFVEQNTNAILDAYEAQGPAAGAAMLASLGEKGLDQGLAGEIRSRVNAGVSGIRTQRREEMADDIVSVERAIGSGNAGQQARNTVERLYNRGALTVAEYGNYQGQIDAAAQRRAKEDAEVTSFASLLSAGLPLDPTSAKHRKALDTAFARDVGGEPVGSKGWQSVAMAYASRTRMLPDSAIAWTRQAMRSPSAEVRANAAQFFTDTERSAPEALTGFDTQTKAYAGMVSSMIASGADPVRAADAAADLTYKITPQVREQRQAQYRDVAKQNMGALTDLVDRDFDPGLLASAPAVSQSLLADFGMQSQRYFELTGDADRARELAWRDLKRVYGPTSVNGDPTMMMMPPERFGVTPEVVRGEISGWLKDNPQADGTTEADVTLVPDLSAQRNAFDAYDGAPLRPSYRVIGKTGEVLVGKDGQPVTYRLPGEQKTTAQLKATLEAQAAANVQGAKAKRRVENNMGRLQEQAPLGMGPVN